MKKLDFILCLTCIAFSLMSLSLYILGIEMEFLRAIGAGVLFGLGLLSFGSALTIYILRVIEVFGRDKH